MCDITPTSMSVVSGSGSYKQFPNPIEKMSITEPQSLSKEGIELNNIDEPDDQEMMEIIVCKLGNLRVSEKKKNYAVQQFINLGNEKWSHWGTKFNNQYKIK